MSEPGPPCGPPSRWCVSGGRRGAAAPRAWAPRNALPLVLLGVAGCAQSPTETRLRWEPPTERIDGSPLQAIDSYRIAWGRTSGGPYDSGEHIVDAPARSAVLRGIAPGRWCFVVYARDVEGGESAPSREVCEQVDRGS